MSEGAGRIDCVHGNALSSDMPGHGTGWDRNGCYSGQDGR
jgi:hypothetical protein